MPAGKNAALSKISCAIHDVQTVTGFKQIPASGNYTSESCTSLYGGARRVLFRDSGPSVSVRQDPSQVSLSASEDL